METGAVIGKLLDRRYELRRLVGRGVVAEVYEAWDATLGRRVAVKVLGEQAAGGALAARFLREARASAWLAHPNVVAVHDAGRDQGVQYIVMELVDGRSLAKLIEAGPVPPERAAAIAADVCLALDHAHRHGVVHRDVKPGNILLATDGTAKVSDFGTARTAVTAGDGREVLGTPEYLAPELLASGAVDSRADLYALGCCLYEMLTGRPPFGRVGEVEGATALDPLTVALRHVRDGLVPPHRRRAGVPAALDRVVVRALAKHPGSRQQTAEELRRNLDRFSRRAPSLPVIAASSTPARRQPVGGPPVPAGPATAAAAARAASAAVPAPVVASRPRSAISGLPVPAAGGAPMPAAAVAEPLSPRPPAGPPPGPRPGPRPGRAQRRAQALDAAAEARNRRRYTAVAGLAALIVVAAVGTVAALSPGPRDTEDAGAVGPPGQAATPAPTSTTPPETTTIETTTTRASTTTRPPATPQTTTTRPVGNQLVTVPNVVGEGISDAAAQLSRRGLGTRVQGVSTRKRQELGDVLRQDPAAGARVSQGTAVTVVVATRLDRGPPG